ncbi:MAG: hypothetical protein ACLTSO_11455 [Coprococcus sp.]
MRWKHRPFKVCHELGLAYFRYTRRDRMKNVAAEGNRCRKSTSGRWPGSARVFERNGNVALLTGVKTLDIYRNYVKIFRNAVMPGY